MKKFKFGLQKVLDVKEMKLKKTQKDLAFVQKQHHEEQEILYKIQYDFEKYCAAMYSEKEENISEIKIKYSHFYQYLDQIHLQKRKISDLEQKIETVRAQLIAEQQDEKILSKLKEKYYATFVNDWRLEEQNVLDEIAVLGIRNSLSF